MKKLMTVVAMVCAAAMVQASTYSWSAIATGIATDQGGAIKGTMYAFDANGTGTSLATITALLDTGDLSALSKSIGNAGVADYLMNSLGGTGTVTDPSSVTGITYDGDKNMTLYGILVDSAEANYAIVTAPSVPWNPSIEAGSAAGFDFGVVMVGPSGSTDWNPINAPEPTSGLLLLLGVAGLALKRKRA